MIKENAYNLYAHKFLAISYICCANSLNSMYFLILERTTVS